MKRFIVAVFAAALSAAAIVADEGMWTFDNFPRKAVTEKYGARITDEWLNRVQEAIVRLESGCTGSFASPDGLVLTNHHCVQTCLAENSTARRDLVAGGFSSTTRAGEVRCQGEQASVLVETEDVTAPVTRALAGVAPADAARTRNQTLTGLEERCEAESQKAGSPLKCETVTLYQGGQHWLYKYKRYDDVRLVFAPESAIAAFGGDPDNFQFPRWCLDMSLLRVYENGRPAATPGHLSFDWSGAKEGEATFVAGHPGTTERLLTVAQLKTQRDVFLPFWLIRFSELRGRLAQYAKTGPEEARTAKDYLDTVENSIKVRRMQLATLLDDRLMEQRAGQERELREAVAADPELQRAAAGAWDEIARAQAVYRDILIPHTWIELGAGFNSDLFQYARHLVRAADERAKPNAERLREYTDAALPQLRQALAADSPVYPGLERVRLSYSLERMREYLGPDHPVVREAIGAATPDERARSLVTGSSLADPKARLALFEGGKAAVDASKDPMITLARAIDGEARALRSVHEDKVQAPEQRAQQAIAEARFKAYGTSIYPDATFTLRLSYGAVQGWKEAGEMVDPFTRLARLYERATGAPPFALPARWLEARPRLDMETPANFVTTNDIVGGNSGSPVVNARGEIVGLVFDGNIHSISGGYWYDSEMNRTVAVHPAFIRTALEDVYAVADVARELGIPEGTGGPAGQPRPRK
ncbi:MAG TPA: S46 family peptidase [Vicinamibacterales bacterium]|nr:S46 family peptidase [Vicinamibacterales bacterium]